MLGATRRPQTVLVSNQPGPDLTIAGMDRQGRTTGLSGADVVAAGAT
jgi:hypothetical protein